MISRLLTLSAAAAFALSASAALDVTFSDGSFNGWEFGTNAKVENGHVVVDMPGGNGSKYRQDFYTNNTDGSITIDPATTKVFAFKFIGEMPMANYTFELNTATDAGWINTKPRSNNNTANTLTTLAGNHILYVDYTNNEAYNALTGIITPSKIQMKVADVAPDAEVHTYTIDWIKGFASLDELKANMEVADDGDDDNDEAVDLSNVPVYIKNTNKPYADFYAAYDAAVNGDEIVINKDQKITSRFGLSKAVTISGATGEEVISATFNNNYIFLVSNTKYGEMAFKNLIITGNGKDTNRGAIEINNGGNIVTFENVTFKDLHLTAERVVKQANAGKAILNNVTFEDCSVPAGNTMVFLGASCWTELNGEISNATVFLQKTNSALKVGAAGITGSTIPVTIGDAREIGATVVEGTTDVEAFPLTNADFHLESDGTNLVLAAGTSGIEGVAIENAPAVYYNLQGVKVAEPTPGLYIMRQGDKTSKVIIR